MPQLNIDVSDVQTFEPFPEGRYTLRFDSYTIKESKGAKTAGIPALNATFVVADGEYKDRRVWAFMLVSGQYAFLMKEFLQAVLGDLEGTPIPSDPDEFLNVTVEAQISIDPSSTETGGNGVPKNKIEHFYPVGGGVEGGDGGLSALFNN